MSGDADIARIAALFADPSRAKVLTALADGRALPASVLADEAGVSPQATSGHLAKLREAGLISVRKSGRHRYYALTGDEVANAIEALAQLAPSKPVRSLREGTRANALRMGRTCYDHFAGQLGVQITEALLDRDALLATDGVASTEARSGEPVVGAAQRHPYALGPSAAETLKLLGLDLDTIVAAPTRRPLLRFCLDWTEHRYHLAGLLGAHVFTAFDENGWVRRLPRQRAVRLTPDGAAVLARLERAGHSRSGHSRSVATNAIRSPR
ncbi:helix-turn-helix transcriptional regulator [Antrihabitans cavernicola]|uniref:Helix-turn-helix transcriptional regulator n=2 Tax=Antrihabitans cavernicola TaxID=2495913 RepID=A0A5A7SGP9_9NOCA|nr:helix-turn-helix transcriptional regulator [Spelaeibacter cavernicola]